MNRRALLASLAASSAFGTRFALARTDTVHRLGVFSAGRSESDLWKLRVGGKGRTLLEALASLGHVEGRNLKVEWRFFNMDYLRAPPMAAELVRLGVDVLQTTGSASTKVLLDATRTIPIATIVDDPVASGLTSSLVQPGGNVTGLMLRHPDTPRKQVEELRTLVPKLERLVLIGNVGNASSREILRPYESASKAAGLVADVRIVDSAAFEGIFSEARGHEARAVLLALGQFANIDLGQVAKLALRHGVATMSNRYGYVEHGGLMSFDMYHAEPFLRWASIISKIFSGIKAADIPWELPDRSRLAINLPTARLLGLRVPAELLLRADEVIE